MVESYIRSNKMLKRLRKNALSFSMLLYEDYKMPVIKKGYISSVYEPEKCDYEFKVNAEVSILIRLYFNIDCSNYCTLRF